MRVVVIGSEGFIGKALVARLLGGGLVCEQPASQVTRLDLHMAPGQSRNDVRCIEGDICDRSVLARAFEGGVDAVFHLASVPGGAAERDFELGLRVNLEATINLLEVLRHTGQAPILVFASTIGVYGVPMPAVIGEHTNPEPSLSYGAHKLAAELLAADYGRRGYVDARSLRVPGIVARPPTPGLLSIFLSDLIRELSAGRPVTCPVGPEGHCWWMSRPCLVDNLLHATTLPHYTVRRQRSFLLPVLHKTVGEIVQGIAEHRGAHIKRLVTYKPDAELQAQFASYPPLLCPQAEAAGFRHDGTVSNLVRRALEGP